MEKRQRKISTSVQLTEKQFEILELIVAAKQNRPSNAEILRDAFDFYVAMRFPQFLKANK